MTMSAGLDRQRDVDQFALNLCPGNDDQGTQLSRPCHRFNSHIPGVIMYKVRDLPPATSGPEAAKPTDLGVASQALNPSSSSAESLPALPHQRARNQSSLVPQRIAQLREQGMMTGPSSADRQAMASKPLSLPAITAPQGNPKTSSQPSVNASTTLPMVPGTQPRPEVSGYRMSEPPRTLTPLSGSFAESFTDSKYEARKVDKGTVFHRAEGRDQGPGTYLGMSRPRSKAQAEAMYNIAIWGNVPDIVRRYRTKSDVYGYYGGVAGGTGEQFKLHRDFNPRTDLDLVDEEDLPSRTASAK